MTRQQNIVRTIGLYHPGPGNTVLAVLLAIALWAYYGWDLLLALLAADASVVGLWLMALRTSSRLPIKLLSAATIDRHLTEIKARVASGEMNLDEAFRAFEVRVGALSRTGDWWVHEIGLTGLVAAARRGIAEEMGTMPGPVQIQPFVVRPPGKHLLN